MRLVLPSLLILISAGILTACGDNKNDAQAPSYASSESAKHSDSPASVEEVANESRGNVHCPAQITTKKAEGSPVDDVVGVRPGMLFDEAANIVMCSDKLLVVKLDDSRKFDIDTYGQKVRNGFSAQVAVAREKPKSYDDNLRELNEKALKRMKNGGREQTFFPGQTKWYVNAMGLPGEERVIGAERVEWFAKDHNPSVISTEQALISKYGKPTVRHDSSNLITLTWAYDPAGQQIEETSRKCNNADVGYMTTDCGLIVGAWISRLHENPGLVDSLKATVVDQAKGFDLITNTKERLKENESVRRAKQVEKAEKQADTPKL